MLYSKSRILNFKLSYQSVDFKSSFQVYIFFTTITFKLSSLLLRFKHSCQSGDFATFQINACVNVNDKTSKFQVLMNTIHFYNIFLLSTLIIQFYVQFNSSFFKDVYLKSFQHLKVWQFLFIINQLLSFKVNFFRKMPRAKSQI